jgi:A/G-specific adenine glycosylase
VASPPLIASRPAFQSALHGWYRAHQRRLPWREAPSLYKTVVSEFMLQQTQVVTVLPYFDRWLRELPDFAALAAASEAKVVKLWEGLGYYSRARNLHRLAQTVAARPAPPRTPAEWRELPGIGPYTAAAIASIAFDEPAACVDGNVVRILARLTGEGKTFRDGSEAARFFTPLADALIVGSHPGTHNQAMMELGATVCLRQKPACLVCPMAAFCVARQNGAPERFPRLKPKRIEPMSVDRAWCVHGGKLLLRCGHAPARRLAGLHELPELADLGFSIPPCPRKVGSADRGDPAGLFRRSKRLLAMPRGSPSGQTPGHLTLLATKRRAITRYAITESIYAVKLTPALRTRIAQGNSLVWMPLDELEHITLSGPHRRWIREFITSQ